LFFEADNNISYVIMLQVWRTAVDNQEFEKLQEDQRHVQHVWWWASITCVRWRFQYKLQTVKLHFSSIFLTLELLDYQKCNIDLFEACVIRMIGGSSSCVLGKDKGKRGFM